MQGKRPMEKAFRPSGDGGCLQLLLNGHEIVRGPGLHFLQQVLRYGSSLHNPQYTNRCSTVQGGK